MDAGEQRERPLIRRLCGAEFFPSRAALVPMPPPVVSILVAELFAEIPEDVSPDCIRCFRDSGSLERTLSALESGRISTKA